MAQLDELSPIQATGVMNGRSRSATELARWVAREHGWLIHGHGTIYDRDGVIVASSIEDLATVGEELGWFAPENVGIDQGHIGRKDPVALKWQVRSILGDPKENG